MHDLLYNIMLQSDVNDIKNLTVNQDAYNISHLKQFWHDKMINDKLPLIAEYNIDDFILLDNAAKIAKEELQNYDIGITRTVGIYHYSLPEKLALKISATNLNVPSGVKPPDFITINKMMPGRYIVSIDPFEYGPITIANYYRDSKISVGLTYDELLDYLTKLYYVINN